MTQQIINIGTVADDGTGDVLRTAFVKTNANFTELYTGVGGGFSYPTRAAAIAAAVPSATSAITTAGYATAGDGGGATYVKVATLKYPTYSFTSADGAIWQYVPEPLGWNAMVAGVKADAVTDDAPALMAALLPFQNPLFVVGGGGVTSTLVVPPRVMALKSLVFYVGSNSAGLTIQGQSQANQGGPKSSAFQWQGPAAAAYPSMFMIYGANNAHIEGINFDGASTTPASKLVNCLHLNADNTLATTLAGSIVAGANRVFTCAAAITGGGTAGVGIGAAIGVGAGTANFEIVYVTAVSGATFTATCVNNHLTGEKVGGSPPCNNLFVVQCTFGIPAIVSSSKSAGILCGNQIQQTVQVSEFQISNCNFVGNGNPGTSYTGIRTIVGGNIKNYSIQNSTFLGLQYGIGGESFSGNVELSYLTFAGTTICDILANGASNLFIANYESESNGQAMLIGSGGANSQGATIIQSSYQSGLPANFYMIDWAGSLTLINNTFFNQFTSPTTASAAVGSNVLTFAALPAWLANGIGIANLSNPASIPSGPTGLLSTAVISSFNPGAGTVTLSQNVLAPGVATGDSIAFTVSPRVRCNGITTDNSTDTNPSGIVSLGNFWQWGSPYTAIFYDGSNNAVNYGDFAVQRKSRIFSSADYGTFGQLPQTMGNVSLMGSALSLENTTAGLLPTTMGTPAEVTHSFTIPFTAFKAASSTVTLTLFNTPPHTKICSAVADVTSAFTGTAGTLTLAVGDNSVGTGTFLLAFDAKSAAVTKGLINADYGASLASATIPSQDGFCFSWGGGDHVTITAVSGTGNLSALAAGSVTVYITSKRYL